MDLIDRTMDALAEAARQTFAQLSNQHSEVNETPTSDGARGSGPKRRSPDESYVGYPAAPIRALAGRWLRARHKGKADEEEGNDPGSGLGLLPPGVEEGLLPD